MRRACKKRRKEKERCCWILLDSNRALRVHQPSHNKYRSSNELFHPILRYLLSKKIISKSHSGIGKEIEHTRSDVGL